jgi:hypothetical protein
LPLSPAVRYDKENRCSLTVSWKGSLSTTFC